jgi:hypothetical protein
MTDLNKNSTTSSCSYTSIVPSNHYEYGRISIVGSIAESFWRGTAYSSEALLKPNADIDIWVDNHKHAEGLKEGKIPLPPYTYINDMANHPNLIRDIKVMPPSIMRLMPKGLADIDTLYTILISHLGWESPHWSKYKAKAITFNMKEHAAVKLELYQELLKYWKKKFGNKPFLSLNKSKSDFFTDYVPYKYEHDLLHGYVAYPNVPLYTKVLKDGQDIAIDKNKFEELSYQDKLELFREEITVIAAERWLLVPNPKVSWYKAYELALEKTVTKLTKNWASEFIIYNLETLSKPEFRKFENLLKYTENDYMKTDIQDFEALLVTMKMMAKKDQYVPDTVKELVYDLSENEIHGMNRELLDDYGFEHMEQEGGGEGGSEYCWAVFRFKNKVYKTEYSYYSYDGHYYDEILDTLREVFPTQKMVTVYE